MWLYLQWSLLLLNDGLVLAIVCSHTKRHYLIDLSYLLFSGYWLYSFVYLFILDYFFRILLDLPSNSTGDGKTLLSFFDSYFTVYFWWLLLNFNL